MWLDKNRYASITLHTLWAKSARTREYTFFSNPSSGVLSGVSLTYPPKTPQKMHLSISWNVTPTNKCQSVKLGEGERLGD